MERPMAWSLKTNGARRLACVGLLAAALGRTALAGAGDWWPQFHGPSRDNMSAETGLLKEWPPEGPELLWKFGECGKGYSGVAIANAMIFTAGDFADKEFVLALDLDGKPLWQAENGKSWRGAEPGSRTTPTFDNGVLYHMNPTGRLAAYEAKTGKELWAVDLRKEYDAQISTWAFAENLLVDGKALLCVPGGTKGRVVALDKATGELLWANTEIAEPAAYCSPILAEHKGVRQLITLMHKSVVGVDVKSGKLLWRHGHPAPYGQNVDRPLFRDGYVLVSAGHNAGSRLLQINDASDGVREVWYSKEMDNCHGGILLLDGYLYGSGCRLYHKGLHCLEFLTGKKASTAVEVGKVSLTWADGLLYCVDQERKVFLVQPSPQGSKIVSRFMLPNVSKDLVLCHPVVCGKRLYIRHDQNLYCYDIAAK